MNERKPKARYIVGIPYRGPLGIGVWGVVEPKRQLSGSIEWSITGKSIS